MSTEITSSKWVPISFAGTLEVIFVPPLEEGENEVAWQARVQDQAVEWKYLQEHDFVTPSGKKLDESACRENLARFLRRDR